MNRAQTVTASPGPEMGRRERRGRETREKIFRAALKLFADRGFFETTTEQITEAADVGQGTFFNYFPSKQHVLAVLAEMQLRTILSARARAQSADARIQDVLHALMHDIAKQPGKSQALTRALIAAFLSNEAVRVLVAEALGAGRRELAAIMATGQKRGEIRLDRKAADLALAFQRGVAGTMLLWPMQSQRSLKSWLEKAFQDFWAGAVAAKGSPR